MMRPGSGAAEFAPIFNWNPAPSRKLSLFSFIAASAVLHALCFYVFQIIYPPAVALLPPPARVHLITADSEAGRVLLRWVEAEDPALSSTTQRPPDAASFALPQPAHVPSYLTRQPAPKELPALLPDLGVPSSRPPGPVPVARASSPPAAGITRSVVIFSGTGALGAAQIPQLDFKASTQEPPQPAQFRIAVGPQGSVRYCFLERPSGDPALDEQARRYLLLARFPPMDALAWTTATFQWGNDIAPTAP